MFCYSILVHVRLQTPDEPCNVFDLGGGNGEITLVASNSSEVTE